MRVVRASAGFRNKHRSHPRPLQLAGNCAACGGVSRNCADYRRGEMTVNPCLRRLNQTTLSVLGDGLSATLAILSCAPPGARMRHMTRSDDDRYWVPPSPHDGSPRPPRRQQPDPPRRVHSYMYSPPTLIHEVVIRASRARGFFRLRGLTCEGERTTTGRWEPSPRSRRCAAAQPIS
jgi:hypothetical protein